MVILQYKLYKYFGFVYFRIKHIGNSIFSFYNPQKFQTTNQNIYKVYIVKSAYEKKSNDFSICTADCDFS